MRLKSLGMLVSVMFALALVIIGLGLDSDSADAASNEGQTSLTKISQPEANASGNEIVRPHADDFGIQLKSTVFGTNFGPNLGVVEPRIENEKAYPGAYLRCGWWIKVGINWYPITKPAWMSPTSHQTVYVKDGKVYQYACSWI